MGEFTRQRGFSLVELSIVLVILGLLTGGILAGQSLIRAAQLRAVSSEYSRYAAAIHSFRDKYFALPGDMPNAVRFWTAQAGGTADGRDATCAALTTAATDQATCNGDGDGLVASNSGARYEKFRLWQHLANAGLVEGHYSGVQGALGNNSAVVGENIPTSKLSPAGWLMLENTDASAPPINVNNFIFGGNQTTNTANTAAVLKPEEAWNIDKKMDDGMPQTGFIVTPMSGGVCTDSVASPNTSYLLTNGDIACQLRFFGI